MRYKVAISLEAATGMFFPQNTKLEAMDTMRRCDPASASSPLAFRTRPALFPAESAAMRLECCEHTAATLHGFFDLVVSLNKPWQQINDVADKMLGNGYHAFERITEYDVALYHDICQVVFLANEAGGEVSPEISLPR